MNVLQAMLSVTRMLRALTPQALLTVRASKVTQAMALFAEVSFFNTARPTKQHNFELKNVFLLLLLLFNTFQAENPVFDESYIL